MSGAIPLLSLCSSLPLVSGVHICLLVGYPTNTVNSGSKQGYVLFILLVNCYLVII